MKLLTNLLCIGLLGLIPTTISATDTMFLSESALAEGINRADKEFSCVLRIDIDFSSLRETFKTTILPVAIETTLEEVLSNCKRLNPGHYRKITAQIQKKGGKVAYLKHVLDTPHYHSTTRLKFEGGYSEEVSFPGSLEHYPIDLECFPSGYSCGSATLVSVESFKLMGVEKRFFVSAAHVFNEIFHSFEGKYSFELLKFAKARVIVGNKVLYSYGIRELFIPKGYSTNHGGYSTNLADIAFGILEDSVPEEIQPANIQINIFEELSDSILPKAYWTCGFPGNAVAIKSHRLPLTFKEQHQHHLTINRNIPRKKVAGLTLIDTYNPIDRILLTNYTEETENAKKLLLNTDSIVYIDHKVLPREISLKNPDTIRASLYLVRENEFSPRIEWSYKATEGMNINDDYLNNMFQKSKQNIGNATHYRCQSVDLRNNQLFFTMTYFKQLPEPYLFCGSGMSGGGVFTVNKEDTLELSATHVGSEYIIDSNGDSVKSIEYHLPVWPFFRDFLEECKAVKEHSDFYQIRR